MEMPREPFGAEPKATEPGAIKALLELAKHLGGAQPVYDAIAMAQESLDGDDPTANQGGSIEVEDWGNMTIGPETLVLETEAGEIHGLPITELSSWLGQ